MRFPAAVLETLIALRLVAFNFHSTSNWVNQP